MFIRKILATILLSVMASGGWATTVSVGLGNSNSNAPWFNSSITRFQQVIDASAFSDSLSIASLSFLNQVGNSSPGTFSGNFDIYLSTTSATVGGLSLVLNNNLGADNSLFASLEVAGTSFSGASLNISGSAFDFDISGGNLLIDIVERDSVGGATTQMLGSRLNPLSSAAFIQNGQAYNAYASLDLEITGGAISAVPIPASGPLMAGAAFLIFRLRRRR